MATTITAGNATNGLAFSADNTGQLEIKTGTGAGTTALTISTAQVATFAGNLTLTGNASGIIKSGTAVASTSGTSIDFTGIPSTAKRITVMFSGVSTSGTSVIIIQLGSTTFSTSGYTAAGLGSSTTALATSSYTTGFGIADSTAAASVYSGQIIISNISGNVWVSSYVMTRGTQQIATGAGVSPSLSGTLDRVRITTVGGTDTFDAGTINILWE